MRRPFLERIVVLSVLMVGGAQPATAQDAGGDQPSVADEDGAARAQFERATALFQSERFALAAQEFEAVYEMMEGHPRQSLIAFNIGQCYANLGENVRARDWLRRYVNEAGAEAPNRVQAQTMLAELETRVELSGGDPAPDSAVSTPEPDAPDPARSGGGGISPVGPIVMSVGGAVLIVGAILGGLALAQRSDVAARCTEERTCPAEAEADADAIVPLAGAADGLLFGGAAVAVVGLVLTLVLPAPDDDAPTAALVCGPSGCLGTVGGTF